MVLQPIDCQPTAIWYSSSDMNYLDATGLVDLGYKMKNEMAGLLRNHWSEIDKNVSNCWSLVI